MSALEENRPSGGRRVRDAILLTVVIAAIIGSAVAGYAHLRDSRWSGFGHDDHSYTSHYHVHLVPASAEAFHVLLPLPSTGEGTEPPAGFVEKLTCSNPDLALTIVLGDHGYALSVSGHGEANISWISHRGNDSGSLYDSLSMLSTYDENATSVKASVSNIGCEVMVDFRYVAIWRYGFGGRTEGHYFQATVAGDGWHEVDIEFQQILIN